MWDLRKRYFDDIFKEFEDLDRVFEELFETGAHRAGEPLYYGYSLTIGPQGKPEIKTWGNVDPGGVASTRGTDGIGVGVGVGVGVPSDVREPFADQIVDEKKNELVITAEMPGVDKKDIKTNATETGLEIKAETKDRKYYKNLQLKAEIEPKSTKATYNNGILEIKARLKKPKKPERHKGYDVKVE